MKKAFLAVITALSLAGFSYAQDDEYEEEEVVYEDEAPAPAAKASGKQKVVYEEVDEDEEADVPAAPAKKKKASKPSTPNANGTIGIGAELTGLNRIRAIYNLNENLGIVALLGFEYGSYSQEIPGSDDDDDDDDDDDRDVKAVDVGGASSSNSSWGASIGGGVIYTMNTPFLPMFIEGDLLLGTTMEDHFLFEMDAFFGAKATLVKSLELAGQIGLVIDYQSWSVGTVDFSTTNFGLGAKVYATWYFM